MARRVAVKRKQQMVKAGRKRSGSIYFRRVPIQYVTNYSTVLLRQIKQYLGNVISFTRDDLLRLPTPEFEQVALITRYRATTIAVGYLVEHGELIQKRFPDLCLPERAEEYQFDETTVSAAYADTIAKLVKGMPGKKSFTIMQVVAKWRTDPQLTLDSKRKAVRNGMSRLVRQNICTKIGGFEYRLGG